MWFLLKVDTKSTAPEIYEGSDFYLNCRGTGLELGCFKKGVGRSKILQALGNNFKG